MNRLINSIGFGIFLANLPLTGLTDAPTTDANGGLFYYLYQGVSLGIFPPLIFLWLGAGTDFGPLIANLKTLLLGGATLAEHLLPVIAIAAYSYMVLVPIMRLLTTEEERKTVMKQARTVSKKEKIIFPIVVTLFVSLTVPSAASLVGMLMLGNLIRESDVVPLLVDTLENSMMYIITILLGISVEASANAELLLSFDTIKIIVLGLFAFIVGTASGFLMGKLMYRLTAGEINPLIGSAGVSAVPMAARVSQVEGNKANPANYLLMHAMGPNVAGVIGSAVAAGILIHFFG